MSVSSRLVRGGYQGILLNLPIVTPGLSPGDRVNFKACQVLSIGRHDDDDEMEEENEEGEKEEEKEKGEDGENEKVPDKEETPEP